MQKKFLCPVILAIFLTACGSEGKIQEVHIVAEDFLEDDTKDASKDIEDETITPPASTDNVEETTEEAVNDAAKQFDGAGYFQEYHTLPAPGSISGIQYVGKDAEQYIFAFPDDETTASSLYVEYGKLIKENGFTVESYKGNYIIKNRDESVAFMGTGHNDEHNYIMMMAFYTEG